MFRAVREWWDVGRWRRPARLFAFEFVVVMAGVLAAQALQSWGAERSDRARGATQVAAAKQNVQSLGATIGFWTRHGPCLREHVRRVATVAGSGGSLVHQKIGRPALPLVPLTSWTEDGRQHALLAVSENELNGLILLNGTATTVSDVQSEIGHEWATFRLIDPEMGIASAEDRSRVRQAAALIDNRIGYLIYAKAQLDRVAGSIGMTIPDGPSPNVQSLVDRCGLLKNWR